MTGSDKAEEDNLAPHKLQPSFIPEEGDAFQGSVCVFVRVRVCACVYTLIEIPVDGVIF